MRTLLILLLLAQTPVALAQSVPFGVHVTSTADDTVGRQFVYEIREKLRSSNGLSFADTDSEALIRLKIVTLDPDSGRGVRTIYSVVLTVRPLDRDADMYWNNFVGICGQAAVESCARGIVAETDSAAVTLRSVIKSALQQNE